MGKFSRQILVQMLKISQSLYHKISTGQQRTLKATSLFWDVIRHRLVICYRHLGKTYQSHIQGPSSPKSPFFLDCLTLEYGTHKLSQKVDKLSKYVA